MSDIYLSFDPFKNVEKPEDRVTLTDGVCKDITDKFEVHYNDDGTYTIIKGK